MHSKKIRELSRHVLAPTPSSQTSQARLQDLSGLQSEFGHCYTFMMQLWLTDFRKSLMISHGVSGLRCQFVRVCPMSTTSWYHKLAARVVLQDELA